MRLILVSLLFVTGCGLSRYREERDTLLRELRDTPIGTYHADLGKTASPPPATDELEATLTVDGVSTPKAISYALARNPELVSALAHWEMLLERVPQRSSFDDPMLFFEEYLQPTETRAGPKERKIVLSQRIPWPGKLGLKGEMALEEARQAEQGYRSRILKVLEVARPDFPVADRSTFADTDQKAAAKGLYLIRDFDPGKPRHPA